MIILLDFMVQVPFTCVYFFPEVTAELTVYAVERYDGVSLVQLEKKSEFKCHLE